MPRTIEMNSVAAQESEEIDGRVGDRIRELRKERGYSVRELAERVGCSASLITRIELHQRRIDSMGLMVELARELSVPVEELLALAGKGLQKNDSYLRLAFPSIQHDYQEQAISDFALMITSAGLTQDELWQVLLNTKMAAEYFQNHRPQE